MASGAPQVRRRSARLRAVSQRRRDGYEMPEHGQSFVPTRKGDAIPLASKRPKQTREAEEAEDLQSERPGKLPRTLYTVSRLGNPPAPPAGSALSASRRSQIGHWVEKNTWPEECFEQDRMYHMLARKKSTASLRRKRSDSSLATSVTPSDQRPREEKSTPYCQANYPFLLEIHGNSYMDDSELGITDASKSLCQDLLQKECAVPRDTVFRDDAFHTACRNLRDRNEARVVQDIARLIVPSPEALAALGDKDLEILIESVNEGWNNSVPVTSVRPQPDFSVGFRQSMFSEDQLKKVQPLLGDFSSLSFLRATWYMYFPFLTSEVKCGLPGIDVADRQNAHSMTLAVRGIVGLFRLAKRENELNGEILTFSISHDHRMVRLYGHYPEIDGSKTKIYRHLIHTFDITLLDGKERWTAYKFTIAVYKYSFNLLKRIHSVIDGLPSDFTLDQPQQPEQFPAGNTSASHPSDSLTAAEQQASGSSQADLQQITPETSTRTANKKKKGR